MQSTEQINKLYLEMLEVIPKELHAMLEKHTTDSLKIVEFYQNSRNEKMNVYALALAFSIATKIVPIMEKSFNVDSN